jgi:hypothetical protein
MILALGGESCSSCQEVTVAFNFVSGCPVHYYALKFVGYCVLFHNLNILVKSLSRGYRFIFKAESLCAL